MNAKQKAEQILSKIVETQGSEQVYQSDKNIALLLVKEIIEALETTTGHCTLRKLDWHEVQSDFKFWNQVKEEITKL